MLNIIDRPNYTSTQLVSLIVQRKNTALHATVTKAMQLIERKSISDPSRVFSSPWLFQGNGNFFLYI